MTILDVNDVKITLERKDIWESVIEVNGKTFIWISNDSVDNFKKELEELLNKYRI